MAVLDLEAAPSELSVHSFLIYDSWCPVKVHLYVSLCEAYNKYRVKHRAKRCNEG